MRKKLALIFGMVSFFFMFEFPKTYAMQLPSDFPSDATYAVIDNVKIWYTSVEPRFPYGYDSVGYWTRTSGWIQMQVYLNGSLVSDLSYDSVHALSGNYDYELTDAPAGVYRMIYYGPNGKIYGDDIFLWNVTDYLGIEPPLDKALPNDNQKITNSINSIGYEVSKNHNEAYTQLKNINQSLTDGFKTLSDSLGVSNNHLSGIKQSVSDAVTRLNSIDGTLKDVNNNLKTSRQPAVKQSPDFSKELDNHKPVQNTVPFSDDTVYFADGAHKTVSDAMPSPNIEPKIWSGVSVPVEQIADGEFVKEIEKMRDAENVADVEMTRESETVADLFENTENYNVSDEMVKQEFSSDPELVKQESNADAEMIKDVMNQDLEMNADKFINTENYSNTNQFIQTEKYDFTNQDSALRWKSVQGVFQ